MMSTGHASGTQTGLRRFSAALAAALCLVGLVRAQTPGPGAAPALPESLLPPIEAIPADQPAPAMVPTSGPAAAPPQDCFWGSADYLFAWVRSASLPPLVTTSPAGTAQAAAGVLGQPGTAVLFGDSRVTGDMRSGVHLDLGAWLTDDHAASIEAGFLLVGSQAALFSAASSGTPILARPYVDVTTGLPASQLVAFPGLAAGSVTGAFRNDNFLGANIDLQGLVFSCKNFRLNALVGYRWLQFNDRLDMATSETATGGALAIGTRINTTDEFSASNSFHGGDFGLKAEYAADPWSVAVIAKLAVGMIHRSVGVLGATQTAVPGAAAEEFNGGFLALSSNSGVFDSYDWVVAPEFGVVIGWDLARNWRLNLGYDFLLLSNVARPGDQVNVNLNPALFPPAAAGASPASPTFQLQKSDIWVQTFSLGLEYRF
jgi:Putative beta barrel porin-7 (BBP7)